jgi:hypothetical protein
MNQEFKFPDEIDNSQETENPSTEIEIEIIDDTPEYDQKRDPMPKEIVEKLDKDELEEYDDNVKEKFKQMKKVWHDERREKEAANREREEAVAFARKIAEENKKVAEENKKMRQMISSGEKEYVETIQSSANMSLEMAKKGYKEAYESGDVDLMMEAQQKLQEANLRLMRANSFKPTALQEEKFEVQTQPEQIQSVPRPDRRAEDWQKDNRWFGSNKVMTAMALGLHDELKDNGVPIGSDEYYETLNKTMRRRFPEQFEETQEEEVPKAPAARPKQRSVVAPAVRTTSPTKVRLTQTQMNLAKKFNLTPEQYAIELKKLGA